ncbi:portal protein [Microcystis phage vB_MweS-yong2]|nr:portal protein [Microcystis phage vB_MweS-yong2]
MNLLDKAIASVAPGWGLSRARARLALDAARGYDAAQQGRRTSSFRRSAGSVNAEVGRALPALRDRSRELVRNSFIGARALDVMCAHAVGSDLSIRFRSKQAQALWNAWAGSCDAEGETGFTGVVSLALRAALEGGDAIVRMIDLPLSSRRAVPLALHVGEGDLIDDARDRANRISGAQRARLGVELGDHDARLGYWLFDAPPGEDTLAIAAGRASSLVPREQVCHLYRRLRPGQVRGVPVFAPVLMAARDYADLMDAVVVKARMEACIGLVVKANDLTGTIGKAAANGESSDRLARMRPGEVHYLRPGEDALAFTPSSNTAFDPVSRATLMGIAAGCGITYDQLTGDLSQANYSSLRAGKIEFRRMLADLQWNMLVPQLIDRVVRRFVDRAILAGLLRASDSNAYPYEIVMPAHEPIDPLKDLEADILAVRAGRMSPQDFIGGWGRHMDDVLEEFRAFFKASDGLVFDIDARSRSRTGQAVGAGAPASNDQQQEPAT